VEGAVLRVKLHRNYRYYIPFVFAVLLFIVVLYFIDATTSKVATDTEKVLRSVKSGDRLITDKSFAETSTKIPLVLGDEIEAIDVPRSMESIQVKKVLIESDKANIIQIVDINTIISFTNNTATEVLLSGRDGIWGSTIKAGESFSQMFEKPGKFEFTINDQPIGVVRVR